MNHSDRNKQALLECLKNIEEIIVFDTETSGLDYNKDQIIQFSGIKVRVFYDNGHYRYTESAVIDEYIRPDEPLIEKIENLTSITNGFLADKQSEREAFLKIREFFGENPVISGYNVPFDIRMVSALYRRNHEVFRYRRALDVLPYARDLVSRTDLIKAAGHDFFKQECIAKVYGLDAQFHLAIEDARVTLKLLFIFINQYLSEPVTEKQKVTVKRVIYKEGYSHDRNGSYVQTDLIPLFFSSRYKQWYPTKKENMSIFDKIDLTELENDVLRMTRLSSIEELSLFRGDTSAMKGEEGTETVCKISGVNLWEKYGKKRIYVMGLSENGKWYNCFFDVPNCAWTCPPFTAASMEKKVLSVTGRDSMITLARDLTKKAS